MAGEETRWARVSRSEFADLHYSDVVSRGSEFGGNGRFWGVQVMIYNPAEEIFLRRDGDGGKTEAHVIGSEVIFPNSREERFNSVSGGGRIDEHPIDIAGRELDEELGGRLGIRFDRRRLVFRDDIPVFACYQERQSGQGVQAYLLGGLLVTFTATQDEALLLSSAGRFVSPEALSRRVDPRSATDVFRPAFRLASWILIRGEGEGGIRELIGALNMAVVDTSLYRARSIGAEFEPGLFEGHVRRIEEGGGHGTEQYASGPG